MAILFVSGLFAVGAFILYKFKRQGLAFLGSPGMWVGPKGHRGLGLCPDGPRPLTSQGVPSARSSPLLHAPILQMREPRLREVKRLSQGHTAEE